MGALRNVAISILVISFFTFVAFFGRLPALRNTPIGALHRLLWIHIPATLRSWDQRLTQGRLSAWVTRQAHILWNDRHPVVMIFFILLLSVSEVLFLPPAWNLLNTFRKFTAVTLLSLPYIFLYASAARDPGYISPENHSQAMSLYPYDFTIFHPGQNYFLLLLWTTGILTSYAAYIGFSLLSDEVRKQVPSWTFRGIGFTWSQFANVWGWVLQEYTRIGAVTLLCFLTTPLIFGLLGYHIYLIWVGTTTNESMKWSDWQAEMTDGFAFKRALATHRHKDETVEAAWTRWPVESQQVVLRTEDGEPPRGPGAIGIGEWERVWRLADVENLYDLGFWDNLADVFLPVNVFREREGAGTDSEATRSRSISPLEAHALAQQ
ncbi:related to SWF1 Spore Wall Formation [Rhynchosporium graminicola]|uniref:Related to SWF1 Spore Wall Formation n=1 Tax=Rhynchosporium graminicola TaxID=2792576 RepID=A0A1E1KFT8_9HELO|nr:related to SWF1 Spore Wall Formation [Rhynchosporium commune]